MASAAAAAAVAALGRVAAAAAPPGPQSSSIGSWHARQPGVSTSIGSLHAAALGRQHTAFRSAAAESAAAWWRQAGAQSLPAVALRRTFSSSAASASGAAASTAAAEVEYPSAAAAAAAPIAVGCLVEWERGGEHRLGRVIKQLANSQSWQVEDASGTVYNVKDAAIKFVLPGGAAYTADDLGAVAAAAASEAAQPELLELAWQLACPDGSASAPVIFTVPQMADFLFNSARAASCAAALRLLRDDRLYFKQVGRSPPMFSPRTAAQVSDLASAAAAAAAAAEAWAEFAAAVGAAAAAPRASKPSADDWRRGPHGERLAAVEALVAGDVLLPAATRSLAAKTLVELGGAPCAQDAAQLLQSVGWWAPHRQLGLEAGGVSEAFTPALEAGAAALLAAPPADADAAARRDFTAAAAVGGEGDLQQRRWGQHCVVTIDDASTTEIDDGLSLERLPDGSLKVWVHIADPSRWVPPGSPLAAEAAARAKSLYLPTGVVPMFPRALAEGPFSLRPGLPTEAVSVGAVVGPDGALLPGSVEAVPSRITPARRLTYDDVDEMLDVCEESDEQDLFDLMQLARLRRRHRRAAGATEIVMPECRVEVEGEHLDDPHVRINAEHQHASNSRQLVAEMMILAGEAVGELGRRLGVPLPYRGQPEPVLPEAEELAAVPPGPCQAVLLRMRMTRSVNQAHAPLRHAGLGLDAYVQFTSPIRRYGDLLAHWQLKAALRGEAPPLSAEALQGVMDTLGANTQRLAKLEREVESYWVAEYFRQATQADPRATWPATFLCWLKQEAGLGRVLLEEMGLETVVRINRPVRPGDELEVRCSHVDVKQGVWRLDAAAP